MLESKLGLDLRHGSDWFREEGRKILRVSLHPHPRDIPPGTLGSIRNQVKLTMEQFSQLVNGHLSGSDYEDLIRGKKEAGLL